MKIGLIDVDGHNFPNLALMKISSYHKSKGDDVEWCDGLSHYERVYMSKVFSFTHDYTQCIYADEIVKGGTGYAFYDNGGGYFKGKDIPLPYDIEHSYPDYSIYPMYTKDTAYGFLTRGCPRGCDFCIVGDKEGLKSVKVADLSEFWNGQRNIVLNDPNILACNDRETLLYDLVKSGSWVDFNQGLDARLLTDGIAELLSKVKVKEIHFAWDRYEDGDKVIKGLDMFAKYSNKPHGHNAIVYTLVNKDTTIEQDLERIYRLREIGYWAYVMVFDKPNAKPVYRDLQRWVNNRFIFAKCERFDDYRKQNPTKI